MTVVVAVGVPGVGKTTVINKAIEMARKEGLDVKVVNFGDVMVSRAVKLGLIGSEKDRDKMRKLPLSDQIKLQKEAASHIHEMAQSSGGVVIVDTHVFIRTPTTYFPGLPKHILDGLKPRGLLVITADPNDVLSRRARDADVRERDKEALEDIQMHQQLTVFGAATVAIYSGANLTIVENKEGKVEEAALKILNAIKSFAGR